MADSETPASPMPTPLPGEGVLSYRVGQIEHSNASLHKKVDRILDKMNEKNVAHELAVQRCGAWGEKIDRVSEEDIPLIHRRIDAVQGSSGAIAAAAAKSEAPSEPPAWGRMDWISFFSGLGALITVIAALITGAFK